MTRLFSLSRPFSEVIRPSLTPAFGLLALYTVLTSVDARAQDLDIAGTAWVTNWPMSSPTVRDGGPSIDFSRYDLLPFIDSLAVQYRFSPNEGGESLSMHFAIEWVEGDGRILNGRRVALEKMPEDVAIESIDFLMKVVVSGEPVAEFYLPLDTLGLGPSPSMTFVDIEDVAWGEVFADIDEVEARRIIAAGFALSDPMIVRVEFDADESAYTQLADSGEPRPPRTIFIPEPDIWIYWRDGRHTWAPQPGSVRRRGDNAPRESGRTLLTGRGRSTRGGDRQETGATNPGGSSETAGDTASRGETREVDDAVSQDDPGDSDDAPSGGRTRGGRDQETESGDGFDLGNLFGSKKDDDDDADDEDLLILPAIAGIAMVGGLAILGGTVGYFGSGSKAPIGFMSGYVEPRGGILLNVSVNNQVFGTAEGPENLVASLTGFFDASNSPIQPAIGLGFRATEEGTEKAIVEPSISLGVVGNFGRLVLLAGYDVTTPDFRFGIAINLRHRN